MSKRYYIPKGWRKLRLGAKINRDTDKMQATVSVLSSKEFLDITKWISWPHSKEVRDQEVVYITPKK